MSRKNQAPIRKTAPDPIYGSEVVAKLINAIMIQGKKSVAQTILYESFSLIKEKTKKEPMEVFNVAIEKISPNLEVKTRRIGGANYQVPSEVSPRRCSALTLRWLVKSARLRNEHTMKERIANEIIDASNGIGAAVKKREDTHKMAEANRAFAHYKW